MGGGGSRRVSWKSSRSWGWRVACRCRIVLGSGHRMRLRIWLVWSLILRGLLLVYKSGKSQLWFIEVRERLYLHRLWSSMRSVGERVQREATLTCSLRDCSFHQGSCLSSSCSRYYTRSRKPNNLETQANRRLQSTRRLAQRSWKLLLCMMGGRRKVEEDWNTICRIDTRKLESE